MGANKLPRTGFVIFATAFEPMASYNPLLTPACFSATTASLLCMLMTVCSSLPILPLLTVLFVSFP
jgi:hypothetical protein